MKVHIKVFIVLATVLSGFCLESNAVSQQGDPVIRLFEELTNADAPTGYEGPVREILFREFKAQGIEVSTDGLGSVIGVKKGKEEGPKVMVVAHMDEVGLMVRYITDDGFIKFQTLGGWLDQALIDQRWVIRTRNGLVHAVSGIPAPHVTPQSMRNRVFPQNEIFLDIGARSKKEAMTMGVRPGDPISPWSPFTPLANNRYAAKAWDDRIGCVIMIEIARRLNAGGIQPPNTLYLVGSVQEEVGVRGSQTSSQVIRPDIGISLEVGIAADFPGMGPDLAQERLGEGPGIFLHDSSMLPNLKLRDFFFRMAEKNGIPLQTEVLSGYGEDASAIQRHSTGTPAINFAVPTRYVHSHTGIIDRSDFDNAVDLLMEVIVNLDAETVADISSF